MTRIAVLISGRGSNMVELARHIQTAELSAEICLVAGSTQCEGLYLAAERGLPTSLFDLAKFADRYAQETALADALEKAGAEWIFLAGYMAILSPTFVNRFAGKIVNIHPSLLPNFRGLNTHARALAAGETWHGATVHIVNEKLDGGQILLQAGLKIATDDTVESLASRVLTLEHMLYPFVLGALITGNLQIKEGIPHWWDTETTLASLNSAMREFLEEHAIWPESL